MRDIVKNTTSISLIEAICPYSCMGCGRPRGALCGCCKNDIRSGEQNYCPICKQVVRRGYCKECRLPFEGMYAVGFREGILRELVEGYKYKSMRALAGILAELVDDSLPHFAEELSIVPLPTIQKHVRRRGFDHTLLLAKKLARRRGWKVERLIRRARNTVQVGVGARQRREQAELAYELKKGARLGAGRKYLLLDDVWTTGASMLTGEKLLRREGAEVIIGATVAISRG